MAAGGHAAAKPACGDHNSAARWRAARFAAASAERVTHAALPVDAWCAYQPLPVRDSVDGRLMPVGGALMSAGCAEVTRVAPVMGRWFTAAEAPVAGRGQALAVITDRYWKRMFNSAPDVLGRAVRLDEGTVTVIGVLPASFSGFDKDVATDIITPFGVFRAVNRRLVAHRTTATAHFARRASRPGDGRVA